MTVWCFDSIWIQVKNVMAIVVKMDLRYLRKLSRFADGTFRNVRAMKIYHGPLDHVIVCIQAFVKDALGLRAAGLVSVGRVGRRPVLII